ncbi:MAG: hydroxyacid dehydrogenase [Flavipsychrobacter sp.]|nr:hydroxyacid dehydrogenase [Flavipsychrobacter sp.]
MSGAGGKVLIAAPVHKVLTDGLAAAGYNCLVHETIVQANAFELLKDCVGVITSTRLQLDKQLLDSAPKLKWIGRMGSGMEVIDVPYAESKGIACHASPEGNCNAVGEHAMGMLLALLHRISLGHEEMKNGVWLREENRGTELGGKTVGIIGYGYTGSAFAKKLQGFDVEILAYDKYAPENIPASVANCKNLEAIYEQSDIVSFHVPLQADTLHYFNDDFLQRMQKPFILINTSRGGVVDTNTLLQGIDGGKITGACLDVFEYEPVSRYDAATADKLNSFFKRPNVIVTPHIAGYTFEALYKMSRVLLDKITG